MDMVLLIGGCNIRESNGRVKPAVLISKDCRRKLLERLIVALKLD